jgi:hypothetical protein
VNFIAVLPSVEPVSRGGNALKNIKQINDLKNKRIARDLS